MKPRRGTQLWSLVFKLHGSLLRLSGGRLGRQVYGLPVLLLTCRGWRSGKLRQTPLCYCEDAGNLAVIASKAGEPENPAWFRNLMAHPNAEVQVAGARRAVRARVAQEPERARVWGRMASIYPEYESYQRRTERRIPVVILEPVPES